MRYEFQAIEQRWQAYWAQNKTFRAPNPGEDGFDPDKPKYYVLDMFPYPSGVGLHVGHPLGYIATDIVARYKRMRGFNVLHPMGYDAFGLPAEQFAVEHGVHPRKTTEDNIANMTRQLKQLGLSYDWDREVATTDVDYYKWTQWIFLQLFNSWFDPAAQQARPIDELETALENEQLYVSVDGELIAPDAEGLDAIEGTPVGAIKWHELSPEDRRGVIDSQRLAYLDEVPVNWCPALGTVLANEEVTAEGKSERGNHPVFKRPLKQWMLRITAYADRLAGDLDDVAWPEATKIMQRNWIGRSVGARVDFAVDKSDDVITVFTTRPDTLFGATYMVLAPEHPMVDALTTPAQQKAVADYQIAAASKSDIDRQAESKQKTGVFTGSYAINPVNNERVPVWIADYVLTGYGTGAIMAVPAHDERDFAFAKTFGLPVRAVVRPSDAWLTEQAKGMDELPGGSGVCHIENTEALFEDYNKAPAAWPEAYTGEGKNINSANAEISLNDWSTGEAKAAITGWLEARGVGKSQVQYKLRDWLFSRQRYWGEPFPILHGPDGEIVAVDESELPVELPAMDDFRPVSSDDPDAPPQPPLSRAPGSWKEVEIDGKVYTREFNTMPQWAGSCWYYLRFIDPGNGERFVGEDAEQYWMVSEKESGGTHAGGVDLYVGGVEHAVLHLLYARFWHKVLYDLGHVSTPEPFGRLYNQGYIQAHAYTDFRRGTYVPAEEVEEGQPITVNEVLVEVPGSNGNLLFSQWEYGLKEAHTFEYEDGMLIEKSAADGSVDRSAGFNLNAFSQPVEISPIDLSVIRVGPFAAGDIVDSAETSWYYNGVPVNREFGKMGKSLKNAIAPDDICEQYGCDTLRLYEMYLGPLDQSKVWRTRDIVGLHRFLQRVWRNFVDEETDKLLIVEGTVPRSGLALLHKKIKQVTEDMDRMSFNTAIAYLIELNNDLVPLREHITRDVAETFVVLLSPFAPHIAEELWSRLGHDESIAHADWPTYDEALLVEDTVEYPVQVNGKLRGVITVAADADDATIEAAAKAEEKVAAAIGDKSVAKVIVIKGKMINLVVK